MSNVFAFKNYFYQNFFDAFKAFARRGVFLLCACSEKHPSLSGDAPVDVRDFIAAFPDVQFPFKAADTNFAKLADTTSIGYNVLQHLFPIVLSARYMARTRRK